MINKMLYTLLLLMLPLMSVAQSNGSMLMPEEIEPVSAPFDMPQLTRPHFPVRTITLRKAKDIQKSIDLLTRKGGGRLVIPKGRWHTGRIILKSNVCVELQEGAELCFSGDLKDYLPVVACRNEGVDIYGPGAMIYADGAENI
ncbi:MAG: glycoside hydrolase family 28 protein, partial [Prevotella sp.]|nr:glycoside hydrolase family 28 protein [Prevotella sp.]